MIPRTRRRATAARRLAAIAAAACALLPACGKKGPPLPPLVHLPAAPADFAAERRGDAVDLQFVVPSANLDNTRPANVARVDVYAFTSREPLTDKQIVEEATRIASVEVKAPKDPTRTIAEDEPEANMEAPEGRGLDQGAVARVTETLTSEATRPIQLKADRRAKTPSAEPVPRPLLPPGSDPPARTYVAFGVTKNDKEGPPSTRLDVPLLPPPPVPGTLAVTYDEQAIALTWQPVPGSVGVQREPLGDELPSTPIGVRPVAFGYNVYETSARPVPARLTPTPLAEAAFADPRVVWGEERCYAVRTVETIGALRIESDAPPPICTTPIDTFAPAAPAGLQSSPAEGAINLIWDASTEKDLAGYIVLRGDSPATLRPLFAEPMTETTFRDPAAAGVRFTYAVKAVDRAGNQSPASKTVEEAAR